MLARCVNAIEFFPEYEMTESVTFNFQHRVLYRSRSILLCLSTLIATGCGFNKSGVVYPELLEARGWQQPSALIQASSFSEYARLVREQVAYARVPFVPANEVQEVNYASPSEFKPAAGCEVTKGIALLVHGLSDSAFSMKDMAQSMTRACFIARTVLLPGHGTRPGDLLTTRLSHWTDTVQYLISQAADEHENVVAVGFSLGSLLILTEALQPDSPIDAVITLSPAFYLTTSPWAELTQWLHPIRRWLDTEKPDDAYRYEAIPTIAVAQTIQAKKRFHRTIEHHGSVSIPWLLIQSDDDLVVRTNKNRRLFERYARNDISELIAYSSAENIVDASGNPEGKPKVTLLPGFSEAHQVTGLTHVAIHQSAQNPHYGVDGDYRNCGSGGPRPRADVRRCEQAENPWLGPWNKDAPNGQPYGMSTYNPNFDVLSERVNAFLNNALRQE